MFLALAGGVGGAKLAYGLSRVLEPKQLLVVVNTGDDFEHLGLSISPDLDTVCYALAELDDLERGWGRAGESWQFMEALESLGQPTWFRLGDADLAIHVTRTRLLTEGASLTQVTQHLCAAMSVPGTVFPMSDDPVATIVHTTEGPLAFQDYFVRRQCVPTAHAFEYRGADSAAMSAGFLQAFRSPDLEGVVICPSNPWLSIAPILALQGVRTALQACTTPVIVVSPIVGGRAVKGPAGKLMAELGLEVSALSIAQHYAPIADGIVIDQADSGLRAAIEALGLKVLVADTLMPDRASRVRLARDVLGGEVWT